MGTNTIASIYSGATADKRYWNQYRDALNGDVVPRNSGGFPDNESGDIGLSSKRFDECNVSEIITKKLISNNRVVSDSDHDITDGKIYNLTGSVSGDSSVTVYVTCGSNPFVIMFSLTSTGYANGSFLWAGSSIVGVDAVAAVAETVGDGAVFTLPAGTYTLTYNYSGAQTYNIKVFELL